MKKPGRKIRLFIIEDNRILREGIISMLKPCRDINIISEHPGGDNTISKIHKLKPNVILLDLGLRSRNSLRIVENVKKEFPEAKIIVMDLVPVNADILRFVKAGAEGFILKDASQDEFLNTIRAVAVGEKILPRQADDSLFASIIKNAVKSGKSKLIQSIKMTKREKAVLTFLGNAFTNKQIALKLRISEISVRGCIHNILEKLTLHARLDPMNFETPKKTLSIFSGSISIINK
ncbi:MAG: response regulator transcription factor [Ignavibacteria bacterium]|nr:response regulator transcription factor [Ignavibacteria bacterium]